MGVWQLGLVWHPHGANRSLLVLVLVVHVCATLDRVCLRSRDTADCYGQTPEQCTKADTVAELVTAFNASFRAVACVRFIDTLALSKLFARGGLVHTFVTHLTVLINKSTNTFTGDAVTFADIMAFDALDLVQQVRCAHLHEAAVVGLRVRGGTVCPWCAATAGTLCAVLDVCDSRDGVPTFPHTRSRCAPTSCLAHHCWPSFSRRCRRRPALPRTSPRAAPATSATTAHTHCPPTVRSHCRHATAPPRLHSLPPGVRALVASLTLAACLWCRPRVRDWCQRVHRQPPGAAVAGPRLPCARHRPQHHRRGQGEWTVPRSTARRHHARVCLCCYAIAIRPPLV